MDILDDMGVSKLSAKVFLKVNYSFNTGLENKNNAFIQQRCIKLVSIRDLTKKNKKYRPKHLNSANGEEYL